MALSHPAGVSQTGAVQEVDGIPTFASCCDAVASTRATASIAFVPPLSVLAAIEEEASAGIELIVTVAEGVPVADGVRALHLVRS